MPQKATLLSWVCGILFFTQSSAVWLDVPFFKQEKDGCGAAVIAMVMQYWSRQKTGSTAPVDMEKIQSALYSKDAHGIYASDVERYLKDHGFSTFAVNGTWDDLQHHLEKGRPLIVALKPMTGQTSFHFVLVVGVDQQAKTVLVNDPAQKKLLKMDQPVFEKEWTSVQRWTLLAVPK